MTKKIFMIAGPNGAGKTTTATSAIMGLEIQKLDIWKEIEGLAHDKQR